MKNINLENFINIFQTMFFSLGAGFSPSSGPVLESDLQLYPFQKWQYFLFIPKYVQCSEMGCFSSKDMQTPPQSPRSGHIYMTDAQCAGTIEKSIFRFLFFELLLIVFTIYKWQEKKIGHFWSVIGIKW